MGASGKGGVGCDELDDGFLSAGTNGLICVEVGILGGSWDMVGAGVADGEPVVEAVVDTFSSEGASMFDESARGTVKSGVGGIPGCVDSVF